MASKIKIDTDFLAHCSQLGMAAIHIFLAAQLLGKLHLLVNAFRRIVRIELVGTPVDVDADSS